jgi:hypothetical protein
VLLELVGIDLIHALLCPLHRAAACREDSAHDGRPRG